MSALNYAQTAASKLSFIPRRPKVLVVDDELIVASYLEDLLCSLELEPTIATNFFDALFLLDRFYFDLLICDVGLGDENGFDLLHLAKKKHPQLPTIMISGLPEPLYFEQASSLGARFVTKPLRFQDFASLVEQIVPLPALAPTV